MRTITLEEHYASPGFLDGPVRELKAQASKFEAGAAQLFEQLCDVGDKRIADMDAARIDMQVLSLTSPGTEQLEGADATAPAREANDFLADAVKKNPARFAGFAALPTATPDKAAEELERMVREHGFTVLLMRAALRRLLVQTFRSGTTGTTITGTTKTAKNLPWQAFSSFPALFRASHRFLLGD